MSDFPHLQIPEKIAGAKKKKPIPIPPKENQTTINKSSNRTLHGQELKNNVDILSNFWKQKKIERIEEELPNLPDSSPLFLRIDPDNWTPDNIETLFGINVISESENGYIIGSSSDIDLKKLRKKIDYFIHESGGHKNVAAKLWEIVTGSAWRIEQILSEELKIKWETIQDDQLYILDISIANYLRMSEAPVHKADEADTNYSEKLNNWKHNYEVKRDSQAMERQEELTHFIVNGYNGEFLSSFIDYEDSFDCRIRVSGKGLKDFVLNYPYVFDVTEADEVKADISNELEGETTLDIITYPPDTIAPKICVIDSGIQENHILLQDGIDPNSGKNFIGGSTTSDDVKGGGHGTKVAGRILYGEIIPRTGYIYFQYWIQNAKVLDSNNKIPSRFSPAQLIQDIIRNYLPLGTKIFNHSINNSNPCRTKHMSSWAASIDKLSFENDILVIISSGNLPDSGNHNPGILDHLNSGRNYPNYLLEKSSRVADPGQSLLGLTVGSLCVGEYETAFEKSFGKRNDISSFSRAGLGIWNTIKPDVVEFGGDFVTSKGGVSITLRDDPATSLELIRTTFLPGPAYAKDAVGTSFSTPGVTKIAAELQKLLPSESALIYKVLIANGARWPLNEPPADTEGKEKYLRVWGYGLASLDRSTDNGPSRITLIGSDKVKPKNLHIYTIKIPGELKRPGSDENILIEVSLSYKAKPRRTRRLTKSYFSGWVKWESSRFDEPLNNFRNRMLEDEEDIRTIENEESDSEIVQHDSIPWYLGRQKNMGVKSIALNDSTLQKDWVIVPSNKLPSEFSIAVTGMRGWDKDPNLEVQYALAVSFEDLGGNLEVYQQIKIENEIEIEQEIRIS